MYLNGLDLFSGIGGITYALRDYVRPVAYCEIEPYCQRVLLSRFSDGTLPNAPIWPDIRTLSIPPQLRQSIHIIYGGFPCQDISVAGLGKGMEGERSGLFFEIMRLAQEIKPTFLFLENVPAITSRGGLQVVREIAKMGYDCRWCVISASGVGALHRRERWFLLAYSKCNRQIQPEHEGQSRFKERVFARDGFIRNTNGKPSEQTNKEALTFSPIKESRGRLARFYRPFRTQEHWQKIVSGMGRVTDGIPHGVDRIKALGNGVVPQQVRKAWEILWTGK